MIAVYTSSCTRNSNYRGDNECGAAPDEKKITDIDDITETESTDNV